MSDFDFDDRLIAGAVNDYQETTMNLIKPQGAAAAIVTAKHRRTVRIASIAAVVAVAVIGAGTAYASLAPGEHAPPPTIGNQRSASPSAPSTATSPSATPSDAGTPTATGSGAAAGTGIHGPDNLNNATLNLPKNDGSPTACPHGPTKFSGGAAGEFTTIEKVLSADVDKDGNSDDVALINCRPGEGALRQVVAFHHGASGAFTTIGQVKEISGDVKYVDDVKVSGSDVQVRVGDLASTYTDSGQLTGVLQWRTYGWNGSKFAQTAGSTSFLADRTANHLTTTMSDLVFGAPSGGRRAGTMTVTVRNTGTHPVRQVVLIMVILDDNPLPQLNGCPTAAVGSMGAPTCQIGTLAAGASKTVTFTTSISESDAEYSIAHGGIQLPNSDAQLRIGDQKYGDTTGVKVTFS